MELDFLNQFHFLRPEWFAAIIPLLLLDILIRKATAKQSGWQSVIPSHLYQYMVIGKTELALTSAGIPAKDGACDCDRHVAFYASNGYDARPTDPR